MPLGSRIEHSCLHTRPCKTNNIICPHFLTEIFFFPLCGISYLINRFFNFSGTDCPVPSKTTAFRLFLLFIAESLESYPIRSIPNDAASLYIFFLAVISSAVGCNFIYIFQRVFIHFSNFKTEKP